MKYHKLRIAWTVTWGVVAVLLCVLWVRSYSSYEVCYFPLTTNRMVNVISLSGALGFSSYLPAKQNLPSNAAVLTGHGILNVNSIELDHPQRMFNAGSSPFGIYFTFPYWLAVAICAAISAAPWLRFRFSLRTLLIATTLVAVVLGLIACLQ